MVMDHKVDQWSLHASLGLHMPPGKANGLELTHHKSLSSCHQHVHVVLYCTVEPP